MSRERLARLHRQHRGRPLRFSALVRGYAEPDERSPRAKVLLYDLWYDGDLICGHVWADREALDERCYPPGTRVEFLATTYHYRHRSGRPDWGVRDLSRVVALEEPC